MKQIRFILYMVIVILLLSACTKDAKKVCYECSTIPEGGVPGYQVNACNDGSEPPTAATYRDGTTGPVYNCKKK